MPGYTQTRTTGAALHSIPTIATNRLNLFEIDGRQYLLAVDRYSKYPTVDKIQTPVSNQAGADKIKSYALLFGRLDEIMTDNGPQFLGQVFQSFIESWGIKHTTSSPHYLRCNGFIESHVWHIKSMILKKCLRERSDVQLTLLQIRVTPIDNSLPSPTELLFGRPVATILPRVESGKEKYRERLEEGSANMKINYDLNSQNKVLPPLYPGQCVQILNRPNNTLHPRIIV